MPEQGTESHERILIIAPLGQDASVMAALLARCGFQANVCETAAEASYQLDAGAGAMLLTEEALEHAQAPDLLERLKAQPPWSELPVIILTRGGESRLAKLLDLAAEAAGSVTLLERPIGEATLLRSVEVALKSRRRQYQVRDLIEEQNRTARELRHSQHRLSEDLASLARLHETATRLVSETSLETVLGEILEAAISLSHADKGNLQLCDRTSDTLRIVVARGFTEKWLDFFGEVREGEGAACAASKRGRRRVIIEDIATDPLFAGTRAREIQLFDGIRAVQSTPLIGRSGELVGVLSTHFKSPWKPDERELHWLDLLARQAADLLERRRAEEALRESETRFRALAENIPQLAWMTNPDGWIFWYNRRWFDYTGTTLEQMQGWGWQAVHHPEHVQSVTEKFKRALESGEPWEDTFPLRGADGNYRWFLSRAFPIRDASRQITRWFGTNTDITELRETQEALRNVQEELKQHAAVLESAVAERTADLRSANEQLEAFVYSIAHDLRAPLRSMTGYSQLLMDDYSERLDESARGMLKRIQASSEFMDRLLVDLLAYGRTARANIELSSVESRKAWEAALVQCAIQIEQSRAHIEVVEPLPTVCAHEATLGQILANLLGNALKFVAPGVQPHVRFRGEQDGNQIRLWVEDNGIGIPSDQQERVFRVFERMYGARYPGTGIGLAIVRKGVERMGGRVGVESEPGRGSRFWIELAK